MVRSYSVQWFGAVVNANGIMLFCFGYSRLKSKVYALPKGKMHVRYIRSFTLHVHKYRINRKKIVPYLTCQESCLTSTREILFFVF